MTIQWKKVVLSGIILMTLGGLMGCSAKKEKASSGKNADGNYEEFITVDVYDGLANYMGIQEGWFAEIVKEKFNMELNVIAPNVAGNGDTLYQTRSAAGDLGDLIIADTGKQLNELVKGGLLYDVTDLYKGMENTAKYDGAVQYANTGLESTYAFPTGVSSLSPETPSEGLDLNYGAYVRWDLYKALGYPEIATVEDILPVIAEMQSKESKTPSGKKVYGFSLFGDWDGNMLGAAKQMVTLNGYDELGFVLSKADGSDYQGILDSDSEYIRALKFYYEANQMGLVDPESTTQNYDTLFAKFQDGQVLYSWWPWLGQAAYNTQDNLDEGKGFMLAPIKQQKIFSYGASPNGAKQFIGIGANAKDPERIADFIDWLFSSEGIMANSSQTAGSSGPEGLMWELNSDNLPELTAFGKDALQNGDATMPEEYGGGSFKDGVSALNVSTVLPIEINPATDAPYNYTLWETYQKEDTNTVKEDWKAEMKVDTTLAYLEKNEQILIAPGASYVVPEDSSEISTLRNQVKSTVVQYSWQMIFAKDEAEFNKLLKEMQDTSKGLNYDEVLKVDMANAKDETKQRAAVVKEYAK